MEFVTFWANPRILFYLLLLAVLYKQPSTTYRIGPLTGHSVVIVGVVVCGYLVVIINCRQWAQSQTEDRSRGEWLALERRGESQFRCCSHWIMDGMAKWVVKCQTTTSIHLRVVLAPRRLVTLSSSQDSSQLNSASSSALENWRWCLALIVQFTEQDDDESWFGCHYHTR